MPEPKRVRVRACESESMQKIERVSAKLSLSTYENESASVRACETAIRKLYKHAKACKNESVSVQD